MIRLRRLRENEVLRNMVRETQISKSDLVYPVFIKEGTNEKNPVDSMPGIYQYTLDRFDEELERIQAAGIPAILIFGIPEHTNVAAALMMKMVSHSVRCARSRRKHRSF